MKDNNFSVGDSVICVFSSNTFEPIEGHLYTVEEIEPTATLVKLTGLKHWYWTGRFVSFLSKETSTNEISRDIK